MERNEVLQKEVEGVYEYEVNEEVPEQTFTPATNQPLTIEKIVQGISLIESKTEREEIFLIENAISDEKTQNPRISTEQNESDWIQKDENYKELSQNKSKKIPIEEKLRIKNIEREVCQRS